MKDSGKMTSAVGRGMKDTKKVILMKGNSRIIKPMEGEYINGLRGRSMMESGKTVRNRDMGCGVAYTATAI